MCFFKLEFDENLFFIWKMQDITSTAWVEASEGGVAQFKFFFKVKVGQSISLKKLNTDPDEAQTNYSENINEIFYLINSDRKIV